MKKITKLVMTLCLTLGLNAGDPGAFEIDFYNAGVPPWLDRDKVLRGLKSKEVWLGVTSRPVEEGRLISRVFKDSSANKAGIEVGDMITNDNWDILFENTKINDVVELGILRGNKKMVKKVKLGARDPLIRKLITIEGEDHHSGEKDRNINDLSTRNKVHVYQKVFLKNKVFDCKNAHKTLSKQMFPKSDFRGAGAEIIVIRGSHRVMFINMGMRYENIGKKTICVNSTDYDGKNLTNKKVNQLYWKLFGEQVDYWYEHP